jgi:hypothetical protein
MASTVDVPAVLAFGRSTAGYGRQPYSSANGTARQPPQMECIELGEKVYRFGCVFSLRSASVENGLGSSANVGSTGCSSRLGGLSELSYGISLPIRLKARPRNPYPQIMAPAIITQKPGCENITFPSPWKPSPPYPSRKYEGWSLSCPVLPQGESPAAFAWLSRHPAPSNGGLQTDSYECSLDGGPFPTRSCVITS